MRVNVICRNLEADRVLPRFARYLRGLGWELTAKPVLGGGADAYYLMGYFEMQMFQAWPPPWSRTASLFTHREETDANKAALYDRMAGEVDLRVAMCRLYGDDLWGYGPTIIPPLPVERDRFVPAKKHRRCKPVIGLSGYTYATHRKGEQLIAAALKATEGRAHWMGSGRGWPVPTKKYHWKDMPGFYQSLDVLVCPSVVEGGPMPVLEALSCGVKVVIPRGVGILDELPDVLGIQRYAKGDAPGMENALKAAMHVGANPEELRAATEPYTVDAWCEGHRVGFEEVLG